MRGRGGVGMRLQLRMTLLVSYTWRSVSLRTKIDGGCELSRKAESIHGSKRACRERKCGS